jgi:hypothetical protein
MRSGAKLMVNGIDDSNLRVCYRYFRHQGAAWVTLGITR